MFNYEYRSTTTAGRVCLEISLKPFGLDKTPEGFERVARELFSQWSALLKYATGCSVLFWTSDGSEILEYTGNPEDSFEWCKYIGIGNWNKSEEAKTKWNVNSLHHYPIYYIENPPAMTYGDLRDIIATMKRVGKEITGFDIKVGETFDPGPEFAWSEFKYVRHPEIAPGDCMGAKLWLHCASRLHAEDKPYAAYPNGIPEGTHLGEFLGRQFMAMKRDLGFDYIWLSNGFGFSLASWNWTGEIFNGKEFDFAGAAKVRENIAEFWKYFNAEIGDTRVETRGSNLSTAMDISAHGCPIDEIYAQKNLVAPPNSPWAAIDSRFGLELAGFMSHIASLPEQGFNLRYYLHDPWWLNSPWFDRYNRNPHDIYLPLAITRLDGNCEVTKPFGLSFLSVDDSLGRLPERGPNEVTPHLLTAYNDYPDEAGAVTWVYPIDTYVKLGLYDGEPQKLFMDDWFVERAVDNGLPLNTVISDGNFIKADKKKLTKTILYTPVPLAGSQLESALFEALELGAKVVLYGSLRDASDKLKKALGITYGEELDGRFDITTTLTLDKFEVGEYATSFEHNALVSNGGIGEISDGSTAVCARISQNGSERAYMTFNESLGLAWIRATFPYFTDKGGALPAITQPSVGFPVALLMRAAMQLFGYSLSFDCYNVNDLLPIVQLAKCRKATVYNLFAKDSTVTMHLTTPDGAPAFDNLEFIIENDVGSYPLSRWNHTDCRIFVKQKARSKISCSRNCPHTHILTDDRVEMRGLVDAEITVYPAEGGTVWATSEPWAVFTGPNIASEFDAERGCYVFKNVNGFLSLMLQEKENFGDYEKLEFIRSTFRDVSDPWKK